MENAELIELLGFRAWRFSLRFRIPGHTVYTSLGMTMEWTGFEMCSLVVQGERRECAHEREKKSFPSAAVTSRHWQFAKEVSE